ncbi:MAG: hypothetical protein HY591_02865 [Candidatus Omnitrophica bacterium]|nr:hypothetical protein [Candidatus Omnitrophota bacterium]
MTKAEHDLLTQTVTEIQSPPGMADAVEFLYAQSDKVHVQRIIDRFLLGPPFEADSEELEKVMSAGLNLTGYGFATANPFNPARLERWGPAVFYAVAGSTLDAVGQNYIIPKSTPNDPLGASHRIVRATIEAMNAGLYSGGVKIQVPNDMKTSREGGIDLRALGAGIKRNVPAVPLSIISLTPVIYSIKAINTPAEFLLILGLNGKT